MKIYVIALFFVFYNIALFGQSYQSYINLGNRQMLNCDYGNASINYRQGIQLNPKYFFKDMKRLVYCSYLLGNYKEIDSLLEKIVVDRRIHPSTLEKEFPYLKIDKKNITKLLKLYKRINSYIPNRNVEYLRYIYETDQNIRKYDLLRNKDPKNQKSIYFSRDSLDEINAIRLLDYLTNNDWPSELETSLYFDNDTEWAILPYVLGIHLVTIQPKLLYYLKENVSKGNIHPSIYASISDHYYNQLRNIDTSYFYMNTSITMVDGVPYIPLVCYSDSLLNKVNRNRAEIGLDSFHVVQNQVVNSRFIGCNKLLQRKVDLCSFSFIDRISSGFVNFAMKLENEDPDNYKINLNSMKIECLCKKVF